MSVNAEDGESAGQMDEIEAEECWQLLATAPVGRVAVVVGHYPVVEPVNFAVDGDAVVFRTSSGSKLDMIHGKHVTFEADEVDADHRSGWSVLVKGVAQSLNVRGNPDLAERSAAAGAAPWAPGDREFLVRIPAEEITGRRVSAPDGR